MLLERVKVDPVRQVVRPCGVEGGDDKMVQVSLPEEGDVKEEVRQETFLGKERNSAKS